MYKHIFLFLAIIFLASCEKANKLDIDVTDIEVKTILKRFDQDFYGSNGVNLAELKNEYPYLFPTQTPDSIWLSKIQDKDEQELFAETQKVYADFSDEKDQLTDLFKHVKYYYKAFKEPKVITLLTNVDYERKVIYADSLLLISLDVFLGKDSQIYQDFPEYVKQNFTKEHIAVAVAEELTRSEIARAKSRTFISRIIQQGKQLYMLDAFLPKVGDAYKIGYTQEQLNWAEANDVEVWKYFVQNKLLFNTDQELSRRFIEDAPFSKFHQANDNETPGRIGVWFGWQIVKAYMQHNTISLQKMLRTDNEEIFKKSKYKPKK